MFIRTTLLSLPILLAVIPAAYADEQDLSKARDALQKQDNGGCSKFCVSELQINMSV